jgi:membrane protein HdeD
MSSAATTPRPADARRRATPLNVMLESTSWDLMLGVVLVLTGAIILADAALASLVSVLLVGWTLLIGGAIGAVLGVFRLREGDSWAAVLSGAISLAIGLVFVRNPTVTLLALSLAAGAVMISGGIIRLFAVTSAPESQLLYVMSSGVLSIVLGLMILNRWPSSALWLLGTLLGIQIVVDGILLMVVGRPHFGAARLSDMVHSFRAMTYRAVDGLGLHRSLR